MKTNYTEVGYIIEKAGHLAKQCECLEDWLLNHYMSRSSEDDLKIAIQNLRIAALLMGELAKKMDKEGEDR